MLRSDWSVKVAGAVLCAIATLSATGSPSGGGRVIADDSAAKATSATDGTSTDSAVDSSTETDSDGGKPAKPAKAGKKPAASRSGAAAKPGARGRSGAGASGAVSRGGSSGGSAMGGGMCGPAAMSSMLGGSGGMQGFSLLAAIGVQSNYGGGTGQGASQTTATGASDGSSLALADGGTEVDVTVKVRVKVGGGFGGAEKECKKGESGSTTSSGGSDTSSTSTTGSEQTAGNSLEARILEFAQSRLGTQVGNGECWTLAAEALKAAGAEPPLQYVFGREVSTSDVRPGMVLQFESARFEGPGYYQLYGAPNHTAIVASVQGSTVQILQQNVNGDRTVQYGELKLGDLVSGTLTVYQPLPKGSSLLNSAR